MSLPTEEDFETRRARLSAEIARQRGELSAAYANLEKPIRYTQYGLRGLSFIRQNTWIFVAVPSVLSVVKTLFGGPSKKSPPPPASSQHSTPERQSQGFTKAAKTGANYAWQLFQIYRRVRPYFP